MPSNPLIPLLTTWIAFWLFCMHREWERIVWPNRITKCRQFVFYWSRMHYLAGSRYLYMLHTTTHSYSCQSEEAPCRIISSGAASASRDEAAAAQEIHSLSPCTINPLNAKATLIHSTRAQRFLKTIQTLSSWYSLDSSSWALSDEYPCARFSDTLQLFCIILLRQN